MNDWSEPFNQKEFEKVLKPFIVLDSDELKSINDKNIYISSAKIRKENNYVRIVVRNVEVLIYIQK